MPHFNLFVLLTYPWQYSRRILDNQFPFLQLLAGVLCSSTIAIGPFRFADEEHPAKANKFIVDSWPLAENKLIVDR